MLPWFQPEELFHFLFILMRCGALLLALPLFGGPGVPPHVKIGLGALTALLLGPTVQPVPGVETVGELLVLVAQEIFIGLSMGFVVALTFYALQVAGHLMDVPIGFGMVNVLDPQFGGQIPILGQFSQALATLIFFTINGHHAVLRALAASYQLIPMGRAAWQGTFAAVIVDAVGGTFALGVRIAVPVIAATFLTDVALGIVSRAVPQINVFITGYPVKIFVGMITLLVAMPLYVAVLGAVFGDGGEMMRWLWTFLRAR
ncbi:MAG: flagellar biosynthetic protein FliR [Firmicutes bacterium ZCTH02-B6]|nr:MAG: flagellar biosynthetic protein FliR [Firmicutes bacterium ZCTH02-B6]